MELFCKFVDIISGDELLGISDEVVHVVTGSRGVILYSSKVVSGLSVSGTVLSESSTGLLITATDDSDVIGSNVSVSVTGLLGL